MDAAEGDVAEVYELRGFDAIHLASALWLKGKTSKPLYFGVFDQRLRGAAMRAGLTVVSRLPDFSKFENV